MLPLDTSFAKPEEPVVLLFVTQGLEAVCLESFRRINSSCRCLILPPGGIDGEASVGKVLLTLERELEDDSTTWLHELLALACDMPGVQSAFALLLAVNGLPPTTEGLLELAHALETSPRWPAALKLWNASSIRRSAVPAEAREECATALRLYRARNAGNDRAAGKVRFRGSAVRDGNHEFDTSQVMGRMGGAAKRRMGWQVSLTAYDTELFSVVSNDVAVAGLPLFAEWRGAASGLSDRPERYFVLPREVRPYLRPDVHVNYGRMRLRPSTCYLLLCLAELREGFSVLDPMGGVGTIAIEAAVRWPGLKVKTSDISCDATEAAELNAVEAQAHLARGSSLTVAQDDARSLQVDSASLDAIVTDVPFGNRNRLVWVNGLLPAFAREAARALRPGGKAVLLMTRAHARQMLQLLGDEETRTVLLPGACSLEDDQGKGVFEEDQDDTSKEAVLRPVFRQVACHKVAVGGWPSAVLVLERTDAALSQSECADVPDAKKPAAGATKVQGKSHGKGKSTNAPGLSGGGEPSECLLWLAPPWQHRLVGRTLADVLMHCWPAHFPTESVARRVTKRHRIWIREGGGENLESSLFRPGRWREPILATQTLLFAPDYPRRSPHESPLKVLFENDQVAVVWKEPGLRLFGGVRTLANILGAQEKRSLMMSPASDALPAPTPVHFLEAELGGCVLVAKTASAALRLGREVPRRSLRAVVQGDVQLDNLDSNPTLHVHRCGPSVRFGKISEVSRKVVGETAAFRRECVQDGHTILGDLEFGGESAPMVRRTQLFLACDGVTFRDPANHDQETDVILSDRKSVV